MKKIFFFITFSLQFNLGEGQSCDVDNFVALSKNSVIQDFALAKAKMNFSMCFIDRDLGLAVHYVDSAFDRLKILKKKKGELLILPHGEPYKALIEKYSFLQNTLLESQNLDTLEELNNASLVFNKAKKTDVKPFFLRKVRKKNQNIPSFKPHFASIVNVLKCPNLELETAKGEITRLKKEKQLHLRTIQRQEKALWGIIMALSLIACVTLLFFRRSKERKRNNQLLSENNEKIELLHQELSHRVKNNLAFISSLMRIQARRLENKEAKEAILEGENRIQVMSLIHRNFYLGSTNRINISDYIKELCRNLKRTSPEIGMKTEFTIVIDEIDVGDEPAVYIGLIINELVTNSFKYAFINQPFPKIDISLNEGKNDVVHLIYKDNGIGILGALDLGKAKSFGLNLVHSLTRQMDGNIEIKNEKGLLIQACFKNEKITA